MTAEALPPLPAIGSAHIEIFGPDPSGGRWDEAIWDSVDWVGLDWRDVTPQSMNARVSWGADDPAGVLTVPAAGSWSVKTYDPDRLLDPSNGYTPYGPSLRPGRPIRLSFMRGDGSRMVVRQGLIDEVTFDLGTLQGTLRGTDQVQLLVSAKLPEGQQTDLAVPATLRARARYFINKAGLALLVPVEPDPVDAETQLPYDPLVGPVVENEASVWSHILNAAYDALYAVWMDNLGTVRFRSFGDPRDNGLAVGGAEGIPIDGLQTQSSLQSVFTEVIAYDMDDPANKPDPTVPIVAIDQGKADIYGRLTLHRRALVPDARVWADSVLLDRAGAALQYSPGTLRIQTEEQLASLITVGMADIAHIAVDSVEPRVNVPSRVLGGSLEMNVESGWSAQLISYIPANEWEEAEAPPPVEPPIEPPPDQIQSGIVRTYACNKDARLAHSGSLDAGNGTDVQIFVGYVGGYRNRGVFGFNAIPFGDVVSIEKAEIILYTSTAVCGSFGSSPKVYVQRITGSWSEGSYNVACGFSSSNSVKYPGPAVTTSGQVSAAVTRTESARVAINITEIARAWLAGQAQQGVLIKSYGEDSGTYSTEFCSRQHGTSSRRPVLSINCTIRLPARRGKAA